MPYRPHSVYTSPYAPPPSPVKRRPGAAWFAVGGALLLVAVVLFGVAMFRFVRTISHTDAVFPAVGTHTVTVPAGTERGLFVHQGAPLPRCQVSDGTGSPLQFRRPVERFTYQRWVAVRVFDTGNGTLVFSCGHSGGVIRIATIPGNGDFARLGIIGVLLPLALGGLGFVVLLVTTILWISRRPSAPQPGAPPGWQPGPPPPGWQAGPPAGWQSGPPPGEQPGPPGS
jgi:hypothetical protein